MLLIMEDEELLISEYEEKQFRELDQAYDAWKSSNSQEDFMILFMRMTIMIRSNLIPIYLKWKNSNSKDK